MLFEAEGDCYSLIKYSHVINRGKNTDYSKGIKQHQQQANPKRPRVKHHRSSLNRKINADTYQCEYDQQSRHMRSVIFPSSFSCKNLFHTCKCIAKLTSSSTSRAFVPISNPGIL